MKLNNELIREILLHIEEKTDGTVPYIRGIKIDGYLKNEIWYHFKLLVNGGYIEACNGLLGIENICYKNLTWKGHEFLESIRDKYVWQEVKREIETVGLVSATLDIIQNLSNKLIKEKLGL